MLNFTFEPANLILHFQDQELSFHAKELKTNFGIFYFFISTHELIPSSVSNSNQNEGKKIKNKILRFNEIYFYHWEEENHNYNSKRILFKENNSNKMQLKREKINESQILLNVIIKKKC
jgi:hypothetical protein